MLVAVDKLAQAKVHARKIFESEGFKYLTGKWKPDPDMLREAAALLENEQPLPYGLAWYAAVALRIQAHKGTKARLKETNYWRNLFITKAVNEMGQFGFKPTRNPEQKTRHCGCSIVAMALPRHFELGEDGIRKVWQSVSKNQKQDRHRLALAKHLSSNQKVTAPGLFAPPPDVGQ